MTKSEELLEKIMKKNDFILERVWFRALLTPIFNNLVSSFGDISKNPKK